jgi:hypothetical protein
MFDFDSMNLTNSTGRRPDFGGHSIEDFALTAEQFRAAHAPNAETVASMRSFTDKMRAPLVEMLDRAAVIVMGKGWLPSECLVVHRSTADGDRYELQVDGRPCLQITLEVEVADQKVTVKTTPMVVAWPPWHPRSPWAPKGEPA